jgi:hypothetical protein
MLHDVLTLVPMQHCAVLAALASFLPCESSLLSVKPLLSTAMVLGTYCLQGQGQLDDTLGVCPCARGHRM